MDKNEVRDTGLEPQDGVEADEPRNEPGEQGEETAPAKELRKLYREMRKWKDRCRELQTKRAEMEEREKDLEKLRLRLADAHITRALVEAASLQDAINPDQVAAFLRARVELGNDLLPAVKKDGGEEQVGTVDELVGAFLSRYPFHRRAKLAGGSGSAPSPTAAAMTLSERIRGASSQEELEKIVSQKKP